MHFSSESVVVIEHKEVNDVPMGEIKQTEKSVLNLQYRRPSVEDGGSMWELVKETGVLDVNSSYSYLMLSKFFSDTCLVAVDETEERLAGFVTGFRPPQNSNSYFVWQIAVSDHYRGQGIATRLIKHLVGELEGIDYITATISPSNKASQSLFARLAKDYNTSVRVSPADGFSAHQFPEGHHEDEHFYSVGPIRKG